VPSEIGNASSGPKKSMNRKQARFATAAMAARITAITVCHLTTEIPAARG